LIADGSSQGTAYYDADVAKHVAAYAADLNLGMRVIVVARSQGNLYANAARVRLNATTSTLTSSFGVDAVATPAERALDGYTTSDDDLVIGILAKLGRTVLPPNIHVPVSFDITGHLFENTYINAQLPARAQVVAVLSALKQIRELGGFSEPRSFEAALMQRQRAKRRLIELLVQQGLLSQGEEQSLPALVAAVHRLLARSQATLVGVCLDDLCLESEALNTPGFAVPHAPSWARRSHLGSEQLAADPSVQAILAACGEGRRRP
jgi:hypothetical protein